MCCGNICYSYTVVNLAYGLGLPHHKVLLSYKPRIETDYKYTLSTNWPEHQAYLPKKLLD